jgi:benzoyl-CoA-dihydrodiol lyase
LDRRIDFQTAPATYRHWRLDFDGAVAILTMDVDENGGLHDGYQLKLNSYDLGVDIELADAVTRLRFEHPEVGAVVVRSGKERVFCAGANIRMLAGAPHAHKVNFCKFTNETRNMLEASGADSGQFYLCAVRGSCAGGGYELALACDRILLADDAASAVSLPEAPLLAVLPGTGGLTRLTDKRRVRRDLADVFCTMEEGARGKRAAEWRLVDEVIPNKTFDETVAARAQEFAARGGARPSQGIAWPALTREFHADGVRYRQVDVAIDRAARRATLTLSGPGDEAPDLFAEGWALRLARELDDAILHLRANEEEIGVWVFRTQGDGARALAQEAALMAARETDWLAREILLYWKRLLKRIDLTSRSLVALIETGSCFSGLLAEIVFACDRAYMQAGDFDGAAPATLTLGASSFGLMAMSNGISRLATRFLGEPQTLASAATLQGRPLEAEAALAAGLVTFAYDDVDWEDEIRIFLEERASFSPDALTGLEANLRFAGPETMETKIFGRLTAWQNWIFIRANAVGENGALRRYGTGKRGEYDRRRV